MGTLFGEVVLITYLTLFYLEQKLEVKSVAQVVVFLWNQQNYLYVHANKMYQIREVQVWLDRCSIMASCISSVNISNT